MANPHREGELATGRDAADRGAGGWHIHPETRLHPAADVPDEEGLVRREAVGIEDRRVLVEVRHLVGQAVAADDHGGRCAGRFEEPAPACEPLTVRGEDDGLGGSRWDVDGDRAPPVVRKRLGEQLSRHSGGTRHVRPWFRLPPAPGGVVIHKATPTWASPWGRSLARHGAPRNDPPPVPQACRRHVPLEAARSERSAGRR